MPLNVSTKARKIARFEDWTENLLSLQTRAKFNPIKKIFKL